MSHDIFMRRAAEIARERMHANAGGPFGAVIVRDGTVIAEGWNAVTTANDPTAHAEVMAIRHACEAVGSFSLDGCTIYTSCEPCPMCLGAIYWARLAHIYYANTRGDAAAIGFDDDFIYREISLSPEARSVPATRLTSPEATTSFAEWLAKPDRVAY